MSLLPMVASKERSSALLGASLSDASRMLSGWGIESDFTVTPARSTVPRAATRSYCGLALSSHDIRVRTAASAAIVPASSLTFSSLRVRRRSARSTLPDTRASTSGSEIGVRITRAASTGLLPRTTWNRRRLTVVLSASPPGLVMARSNAMSRAGSGRSG